MTERLCPNCSDPMTTCTGSYPQSCWKRKCEKLQQQNDELTAAAQHRAPHQDSCERLLLEASDLSRVSHLETVFQGAVHDHYAEAITATRLPLAYRIRSENLGFLLKLARVAVEPFDIMIHCPMCKTKHVDEGEFEHREHHTHSCQGYTEDEHGKRRYCGHTWRPAKRPTRGIEYIEGFINELKP